MSQTTIELDNGVLEVSKVVGIPQQYSVGEIQSPEKRSGNYSKTVILPGTKNNNILLGNLFDVNEDFTFFNPNIKTPARVVTDSTVTLDGYLQLVSIDKLADSDLSGNKIQYKITVFEKSVDFFNVVGDKLLSELDFSDYDHTLDHPTITATWAGGRTSADVYAYPLLRKGSDSYETTDFKPAIYHKAYLEAIAIANGFNLSGTFLDNETYNKEIIPSSVSGDIFLPDAEIVRRKFRAGTSAATTLLHNDTLLGGLANGNGASFNSAISLFDSFDDDSTSPNFDPNGHYNTTTNIYTADSTGSYNLVFDAYLEMVFSTASIEAWQNTYRIINTPVTQENNRTLNNIFAYGIRAYIYVNGVKVGANYSTNTSLLAPKATGTASTFNAGNSYTVTDNASITITTNNIYLIAGDEVTIQYQLTDGGGSTYLNYTDTAGTGTGTPVSVNFDLNVLDTFGSGTSTIYNEPNGGQATDGDTIVLNNYINPKAKQKDILLDILKRYNVYIYGGTNNSKEIVIDSRDSYYAQGGILDWTDKKDFSRADKIQLISELQSKELEFTYSEGDDIYNEQYTETVSGDIYGKQTVSFDNEFTKGTKKIETPFAPTPLVQNTPNNALIVSAIGTSTSYEELRVLYFDGVIDTNNSKSWTFDWVNGGTPTTTTYTTYPYAGHFNNPFNPTVDINFGALPYTWYSALNQNTDSNLYNNYWKSYVNQMAEGRLVTSYFNLTEVDISFIKDNLNSKIWVKDSYYFINAIKDYNPTNSELTKVELLKIVDGVAFTSETSVNDENRNPYEGSDNTAVPTVSQGGGGNTINSYDTLVVGTNNTIGFNSESTIVTGTNNAIGDNNTSSVILGGDNNIIDSGVTNSYIIGASNKTISQDNESWVGDINIVDGVVQSMADVDLTIKSTTVSLSAANLLSGSAIDVPGADAPGVGFALRVIDMSVSYIFNTAAFDVGVRIDAITDTAATRQFQSSNVLALEASRFVGCRQSKATGIQLVENKKLTVQANAASTSGDSTAVVYITYKTITL